MGAGIDPVPPFFVPGESEVPGCTAMPLKKRVGFQKRRVGDFFEAKTSHTNDHFLTDTTKDNKWLVLVGRPPLAAISVGGRGRPPTCMEPRPTELFLSPRALKRLLFVIRSARKYLSFKAAEILHFRSSPFRMT